VLKISRNTGIVDFRVAPTIGGAPISGGGGLDQATADARYVNLTGDTMTGALTMDPGAEIHMRGDTTHPNAIYGWKNDLPRWIVRPGNDEPESTGNAGSNFDFVSFDDTGAFLGVPLKITRSTGKVNVNNLDVSGMSSMYGGLTVAGQAVGPYGITWATLTMVNQDASTNVGIINTAVGASAACTLEMVGGTGNSYVIAALNDNNGAPNFVFTAGAAVNGWHFINTGLVVGGPVGGNKGAGTINVEQSVTIGATVTDAKHAATKEYVDAAIAAALAAHVSKWG
jgi:hypothetical protein